MRRYRYRTSVIVGPWRDAPDQADADAMRAKQARASEAGEGIVWLVPGEIETSGGSEESPPQQQ